jgi:tetratricopeptide (TPR) repeat protein
VSSKGQTAFSYDQLEQLLSEMVAHILAHQDFEAFIAWMRANARRFFGHMAFTDEGGPPALAAMVARSVWNRTPLPGNGFKPRPVPAPGRNDPCPCGSGEKYKHCCADLPQFDAMETDDIWTMMARQLSPAQLRKAIETKHMPPGALAEAARRDLDAGMPKRAVDLLQPLFDGDLARCDERCEAALDALCDAYQTLGHDRKRLVFLERVSQQCTGPLAAAAWQRLAAMRMDRSDHEGAWDAFRGAQKADPDSPTLALNEITLLLGEGRAAEAAARASFYVARFRKLGFGDEDWMESLEAAARDPHRAIADMSMESAGVDVDRLRAWLDGCVARPLPQYEVTPPEEVDPENEQQAVAFFRRQLSAMDLPAGELTRMAKRMARQLKKEHISREQSRQQAALFPGEAQETRDEHAKARLLVVPVSLLELESRWRRVYPCEKPLGTSSGVTEGIAAWHPDVLAPWLDFLDAHPAAGDSLDIIDDVATALIAFDARLPQGAGFGLAAALAERGGAIITAAVGDTDIELPWVCLENRAGLRLLARVVHGCLDRGEHDRAATWMRTLLRLNPSDNHGFRALLVNYLLRNDDEEAALELIARYPDDLMVELKYGAVLAHLRRGEEQLAAGVLEGALLGNAHVPSYLIKQRVAPPRLDPETVTMGGRDEAWMYRENARDMWVATPGALDWLKRGARPSRK